jgi:LysR family glycine cleavage system transcriptional activator
MNLVHTCAMDRLPPFDALVAFEAARRLGSMTLAATELGLTQSAVSHRVRRLEAFMGEPLLRRLPGGLQATPAGDAVAAGLERVLDEMAGLRARCIAAAPARRLRIGVAAALADNWLVRRLPDFTAAHPDIQVELAVVENEGPGADVDLRILWVPIAEARATSTQTPLFREKVFPVCHPALLTDAAAAAGDLTRLPLLHKGARGGQGLEWEWTTWFARLGLPGPPGVALRFSAIGPAIAAALSGAGVALARSMLVHDALADGRLVRLLPASWDLPCGKAHMVRWPAALRDDARVRSFAAWLAAQAGESVA